MTGETPWEQFSGRRGTPAAVHSAGALAETLLICQAEKRLNAVPPVAQGVSRVWERGLFFRTCVSPASTFCYALDEFEPDLKKNTGCPRPNPEIPNPPAAGGLGKGVLQSTSGGFDKGLESRTAGSARWTLFSFALER